MRRLLFSLVSTKISHSPSHGITAAAVLKDIPNASAVFRISGYIGDRIRLDIAKDARGIFSPFPACLRKPRFFMQLSQAIDRRNGIRRRLVQYEQLFLIRLQIFAIRTKAVFYIYTTAPSACSNLNLGMIQ